MPTSAPPHAHGVGSRWPVMLTVLAVLLLLVALPARAKAGPDWAVYVLAATVLAPMVGVMLTGGELRWLRVERTVTLLFCLLVGTSTIVTLGVVVHAMVQRSAAFGGLELLSSSIAVWITNLLAFSLLYWQVDRGGPGARAEAANVLPDWQFPQSAAPECVPPGWRPKFVDYLALAYTTAAAFSPTDVLPMTSRAKCLMMLESVISLVTIVAVAARAINVLGS